MKLAIVLGVEKYQSSLFDNLPACKNDATTFSAVLTSVKDVTETLFLIDATGLVAKKKIADFIEKYKGNDIDELSFYFSGHGERLPDDFLYLFGDFDRSRKETTSLRNTELDALVKTLSPGLFIKIVDACYSGTQYIKGESGSNDEYLSKSISKNGFNKVYFWYSSAGTEPSWAGTEYSRFTESILTALTECSGDVRYSEIMSRVADDMANKEVAPPTFVSQSDHIEKFGTVTSETHDLIFSFFGLPPCTSPAPSNTASAVEHPLSLYDLVIRKSDESCFDEKTILNFISEFSALLPNWGEDLLKLYEISVSSASDPADLPNAASIGTWLQQSQNHKYFACTAFIEEDYVVEEYKALPKSSRRTALAVVADFWGNDEKSYKLEKLTRTKSIISGFYYTHAAADRISAVRFTPKFGIIDPINLHTAVLYSNTSITIHFSYELLSRRDWGTFTSPMCKEWRILKINPNADEPAKAAFVHIFEEVRSWIEGIFKSKID